MRTLVVTILCAVCVLISAKDSNVVQTHTLTVKEKIDVLKVIEIASEKELDQSLEKEISADVKAILDEVEEIEKSQSPRESS